MQHVFVDLENIGFIDVNLLKTQPYVFHLFFGSGQTEVDIATVELLLARSDSVHLIRSPKPGKNALDFVLAYHLGQAVQREPRGCFHLVSRDVGFDSLVELLKSRKIRVKRHMDWSTLQPAHPEIPPPPPVAPRKKPAPTPEPAARPAPAPPAWQAIKLVLTQSPRNRPKKAATLLTYVRQHLGKSGTEEQAEKVIQELRQKSLVIVSEDGNVSYGALG